MGRDIARQNATVLAKSEPKVVEKFDGALAGSLDAGQLLALTALLTGASATAAARAAKVHRGTVHRWLKEDPAFIAEYNLARKEMAEALGQDLRFLASEAVGVLRTLMVDPETPPALRLRAVIEALKASSPLPDQPTTVEDVEADLAKEARRSNHSRILARVGTGTLPPLLISKASK